MKSSIILALGLALAGNAMATDPAPQAQASASSLKVGIDKTTGKLRPLTAAESAALDAQAAKQAKAAAGRTSQRQTLAGGHNTPGNFPSTEAEAATKTWTANGITMSKPTQDMLSSLSVTRNADGTLTYSEGEAAEPAASNRVEADK